MTFYDDLLSEGRAERTPLLRVERGGADPDLCRVHYTTTAMNPAKLVVKRAPYGA